MDCHLDIELLRNAQTRIDGRRCRAPVFMQFQPEGAGANLFAERVGQCRVSFSKEAEIQRESLGRLIHSPDVPRAGCARRCVSAGRRTGAATNQRCHSGVERFGNLIGRNEVNVGVDAAGGKNLTFSREDLCRSADFHAWSDAIHDSGVARLANGGDAAVTYGDIRLVNSRVIQDERVGDDKVWGAACSRRFGRLSHSVANDLAAAKLHLVAIPRMVALDLNDQVGVSQPNAVAFGWAIVIRVSMPVDSHLSFPFTRPLMPYTVRVPASATRSTSFVSPGSKRTAVPAAMFNRMP